MMSEEEHIWRLLHKRTIVKARARKYVDHSHKMSLETALHCNV